MKAGKSDNPSYIDAKVVKDAVAALRENLKEYADKPQVRNGKLQLFNDQDMFFITLALQKAPEFVSWKPYSVRVPHPVFDMEDGEVCLIVKSDHRHYRELAREGKLPKQVKKVLDVQKLRGVYRQYEARRKLVHSYDLFLVDKRVMDKMPSLLGRDFFSKKKIPVPIKTEESVIAEQIENAIKNFTYVRREVGTTVTCKAGPTTMSDKDIVENLIAVANGVANLPGIGWPNIKVMYARTSHSPSLPLFVADTLTAVPEAKGESKQKARLAALQARGEEIAKGEDEDEAEEFRKLKKILGDDDFNRIMRDMAEEEQYIKKHPEVLTRPRRPRIRVTSDDEFSDDDSEEENEVGEVFEKRKDIVSAKEPKEKKSSVEPPAKKQKTAEKATAVNVEQEKPKDDKKGNKDVHDDDETSDDDDTIVDVEPDKEDDKEKEKEKEKEAPAVVPKTPAKSRPKPAPVSTVKTRAALRKEMEEAASKEASSTTPEPPAPTPAKRTRKSTTRKTATKK